MSYRAFARPSDRSSPSTDRQRRRTKSDDDRDEARALADLIAVAVPDGRIDSPALFRTVGAALRGGKSSAVVRQAIIRWRRGLDEHPYISSAHFEAIRDRAQREDSCNA